MPTNTNKIADAPTQGADARPVALRIVNATREFYLGFVSNAIKDAAMWDRVRKDSVTQMAALQVEAILELTTRDAAPSDAISDVLAERKRQDAQWGGQDHDDQHTKADWQNYIYHQHYVASSFCGTPEQYRVRLVKIAALAVAAIESIDRLAASAPMEKT